LSFSVNRVILFKLKKEKKNEKKKEKN